MVIVTIDTETDDHHRGLHVRHSEDSLTRFVLSSILDPFVHEGSRRRIKNSALHFCNPRLCSGKLPAPWRHSRTLSPQCVHTINVPHPKPTSVAFSSYRTHTCATRIPTCSLRRCSSRMAPGVRNRIYKPPSHSVEENIISTIK